MNRKAQISVEFIIVLVLLFIILLFSVAIFNEKNSGIIFSQQQKESKFIANKIARTINSVYLAGNGAEAKVLLEKNFDYEVNFFENAVQISFNGQYFDAPLLTSNITFTDFSAGEFINVKNKGGQILVESSTIISVPIVGDQTIPVILLEAPISGYEDADGIMQFDYTVNDSNSAIASCSLMINGFADQTDNTITEGITQSFNKIGMTNGSYTWDVDCTDDSSNSNTGSSGEARPFTVNIPIDDTTPPIVLLDAPADAYDDADGTIQFDYNVDDSESGIASCSLLIDAVVDQTDNSITEGVTQSFTKAGMVDGSYTWNVECTDDSVNANVGSGTQRNFTVTIPVGPTTVTRWATAALVGTVNITGTADNTPDIITNNNLVGTTFDVSGLSGTITQVRIIWSHAIPGTLNDDTVPISYGFTNYNDIVVTTYNSGNTPVDFMDVSSAVWEYYDATSNRPGGGSWQWSDFAGLQIGGEYVKTKGPDSSWNLDAVGVEITYT